MAISSDTISITLPRSWEELSRGRLYYLFGLIADNLSYAQIKTYCLFKWGGIRIRYRRADGYAVEKDGVSGVVRPEVIADAIASLDWVGSMPETPVRIDRIGFWRAADAQLQGFPFGDYIACDNYFQGYLHAQDEKLIVELARLLYGSKHLRVNRTEKLSVFYWFAAVKALFARTFPHFFRPVGEVSVSNLLDGGDALGRRITEAMNAQIRALTKGDVTKERLIMRTDTWRALAELDAQAKECEDLKKYSNGK